MISKRFACKKFYNIVFLLYTIHVEASLMRWLGEFQIAQIESLVLKLSKFVKICRTCLLLRLLEREVIHRVYLPSLRMTVWSSAKMISVRLTILSCVREGVNWKKNVFFRALPKLPNPPPPWPQFGQIGPLFSEVEIQDLNVSLELKILYILYDILYICNLKNS